MSAGGGGGGPDGGFGKIFSDPNLFGKLAANPKTAPLLADQAFLQKVYSYRPWLMRLWADVSIASTPATKPGSSFFVSLYASDSSAYLRCYYLERCKIRV